MKVAFSRWLFYTRSSGQYRTSKKVNMLVQRLNCILLLVLLLLSVDCNLAYGKDADATAPAAAEGGADAIFIDLGKLVREYYAKAAVTSDKEGVKFKYKVKNEVSFYGGKKSVEVPISGGILGEVTLVSGKYEGKDKDRLSSEEREGFHSKLVIAPYSSKRNAHLFAQLLFPEDVAIEFKQRFKELVNSFQDKAPVESDTKVSGGATSGDTSTATTVPGKTEGGTSTIATSGDAKNGSTEPETQVVINEPENQNVSGGEPKQEIAVRQELSSYGILLEAEVEGARAVKSITAGSRAEGWGIKPGDIIRNTSDPSKLQVERNAEKFKANLKVDKAIFQAVKKMAGQYFGRVSVPTVTLGEGAADNGPGTPMWTQFYVYPDGSFVGRYSESQGSCDGQLTNAKVISPQVVSFNWRDNYGKGLLMLSFSNDYKSFNGYWNFSECNGLGGSSTMRKFGPTTRSLRWSGARQKSAGKAK